MIDDRKYVASIRELVSRERAGYLVSLRHLPFKQQKGLTQFASSHGERQIVFGDVATELGTGSRRNRCPFSAADDIGNPTLRDLAESDRSVGRPRAGKQEEDVKFEIGDRQGTRRRPVKNQRGVKRKRKRKMTDGTS